MQLHADANQLVAGGILQALQSFATLKPGNAMHGQCTAAHAAAVVVGALPEVELQGMQEVVVCPEGQHRRVRELL
jgi:hypothetical protein